MAGVVRCCALCSQQTAKRIVPNPHQVTNGKRHVQARAHNLIAQNCTVLVTRKPLFEFVRRSEKLECFLCIRQSNFSLAPSVVGKVWATQFSFQDDDLLFKSGYVLTQRLLQAFLQGLPCSALQNGQTRWITVVDAMVERSRDKFRCLSTMWST